MRRREQEVTKLNRDKHSKNRIIVMHTSAQENELKGYFVHKKKIHSFPITEYFGKYIHIDGTVKILRNICNLYRFSL